MTIKTNFVAKHAHKNNKSIIFKDKKKALKRGERKHKQMRSGSYSSESYSIAA